MSSPKMTIQTPIFPDRMTRAADYDRFGANLLVTKIFPTIQGEGPFAGQRAVFVRLAGCNLGGKGVNGPGCSFCDTDFRFFEGMPGSVDEVIRGIMSHMPGNLRRHQLVVVTGGEPMLQRNLSALIMHQMHNQYDWQWQIESNGTTLLEDFPEWPYLVVSPKVIEGSTILAPAYYTPPKAVLERADCLKFIVTADPSSPYHNVPDFAHEFKRGPVYVSPMAVYKEGVTSPNKATASIWDSNTFDQQACARNHAHAAKLAQEHGFIMTVQMHLYCGVE